MWTPNQSISDGKYIIQDVLGEGGFGITYSAIETSSEQLVAIKTLNGKRQRAKDFPKQQERFVNEAFNLRAFSHPHVVKVHKMIQEDGLWAMVMEFIDGVDLNDYVDEYGQLSENDALLYIDQIGQALEYIHQQDGMIHRDIKPHNIVLRRGKKETILVDFGLACKIDKLTTRDGRTPGYAPPEQYHPDGKLGLYTDVYALATTLYYLLTADGLKEKDEYIHESIIRKYGSLPLKPPQYYNSLISNKVNNAIIKGMELEVENRPQTVGEFRELLGLVNSKTQGDVQIKSTVGMDYTGLGDLLAAGKWKEADKETARVMLVVANREEEGWLDIKSIDKFPCEDLRTIDQLWGKYSNGRFSFSAQKKIYQSLGGTRYYDQKIWEAFGEVVGWRKRGEWLYYKHINFDIKAPEAQFPACLWLLVFKIMSSFEFMNVGWDIFFRIETCDLPNPKSEIQNPELSELDDIQLISAVDMDYTHLRELLAARKWKDADEETARVMLAVAKREEEGWLDIESSDNFPYEDLRTIDQLWVKYSDGHFGFSVQKHIYKNMGGTEQIRKYNSEVWRNFGEIIGWKKIGGDWLYYKHITFDITAPKAHLPVVRCLFSFLGRDWEGLVEVACYVGSRCGGGFSLLSRRDLLCYEQKSEIKTYKLAQLNDVELISSVGMDYTQLRNFLMRGMWQEADEETTELMLAVAKRKNKNWLDYESISNFPCEDLRTIDQLWVKYSNGRFGFSVQKRIYQSLAATARQYKDNVWEAFGDIVGWSLGRRWLYDYEIAFDITAPEGHLPMSIGYSQDWTWIGDWEDKVRLGGFFRYLFLRKDL